MQVEKLNHVNIRTNHLPVMVEWYTQVLGMEQGDRPNFSFGGTWLYAGDGTPAVHLVEVEGCPGKGSESDLRLEHFAFAATGRAEFEARLVEMGEQFRCSELTSVNLVQVNVWDPDGNHIHVDFKADE